MSTEEFTLCIWCGRPLRSIERSRVGLWFEPTQEAEKRNVQGRTPLCGDCWDIFEDATIAIQNKQGIQIGRMTRKSLRRTVPGR